MHHKAVIFDLFGTLVDERPAEFSAALEKVIALLEVPEAVFQRHWNAMRPARNLGHLSIEAQFRRICEAGGVTPSPGRMAAALALYTRNRLATLSPRADVLPTLVKLRELGLRRGLISNCSTVDCTIWPTAGIAPEIDAAVLSAEVGLWKPDPRIFTLACARLNVLPPYCMYVGDGASGEITAATALGMEAVLIRTPAEDLVQMRDMEDARTWKGPAITSISQVLDLVAPSD